MYFFKLLFISLLLVSCTSNQTYTQSKKSIIKSISPYEIGNNISVKRDTFKKETTYSGGDIAVKGGNTWLSKLVNKADVLLIRATKLQGNFSYEIYISDRFLESSVGMYPRSAFDSNGNQLKFSRINSEYVGTNSTLGLKKNQLLKYTARILVSKKYLKNSFESGISIRAYMKEEKGHLNYRIPGEYVEGFLNGIELYEMNN